MDPGEECDDGNASACGTCNEACSRAQPPAAAFGNIATIVPSEIADGEAFFLNDGLHPAVRFEFDKDGTTEGTSVPVDLTFHESAGEVALAMAEAIQSVGDSLRITARTIPYADLVELTHDVKGSVGNQPILESVTQSGFTAHDMFGGAGFDCPARTGCVQNEDCASGLVCRAEKACGTP